MATRPPACLLPALALLFPLALMGAAPEVPAYHVVQRFTLGGEGGWDYLAFDGGASRLFIARATRVMVVGAKSGKLEAEIPDTPGVHGVALAPSLHRGFTSNGREGTVSIFDLDTLEVKAKVKVGENPDAILFDPATSRVLTFNGRSHDATAIDAASGTVVGTLPLGGKPEFAVSDGKGRVYANIESTSEIAAIDPRALEVVARFSLDPCQEPTGLAIDVAGGHLFSGCSNRRMAVVDIARGKVVATPEIGGGVDATAWDPDEKVALSSNGEGSLTVVKEGPPGTFAVVQTLTTAPGARTMALDPETHTVYLVTAKRGARPSPTPAEPHPFPPVVPGTFELLVVGR